MKKSEYIIRADSITKRFNRNLLFKNISFTFKTGDSFAITGPNGSGKSTLMQIAALLQKPTKGRVEMLKDGSMLMQGESSNHIGFISPLINPYEELTCYENIRFVKDKWIEEKDIDNFLEMFDLASHRDKAVKHYSSGMKQRLKFIISIINKPPVLFLDEPGTNLDRKGKDLIYSYIESVKKDRIIVVATNEMEEVRLCREEIKLGK